MVNFAVLGCGKICHRFIKGLSLVENGRLVGFGARDVEKARQYANQYGVSLFGSYEEILKNAEVDAVYISTYNPGHFELIKMALEHHKHVLSEKPMVATEEKYKALFQIARENHCLLMEAFKGVFLPLNQEIKEIMTSGQLGEIRYIHASYCSGGGWPKEHWIFDKETGGCLQDVGSYPATVVSHLLGYPDFDLIHKYITYYNGVPGFAQVICRLNDLQIQLNSSNINPTENYLEVYGNKGMIKAKNFWKGNSYQIVLYEQNLNENREVEMKSDFYYETQHFVNCLEKGMIQSDILSEEVTLKLLKLTDQNNY